VWLDYDVAPIAPARPADVPRPPAGTQLAAMLPGPFAGMRAAGATSNGDGSISGSGGFAGAAMTWSATVRAGESEAFGDTIDYGGMPVSFSHSESAGDSEFTATVKIGVPSEWADQDTANAFLANALTSGKLYEAALHPSSFGATTLASPAGMKKFIEVSYQVYSGADNASSLVSEAFKGPEEALNRLVDLPYEIENSCLSDTEKTLLKLQVNAAALEISFTSAAAQVIPAAVFVLGFFVPVPGLNIVADFALGKFLSFASDKLNLLNAQLTAGNVESALEHAKCPEPPKPPKKPPTGDPTYIFDPSGFTYEALPGERLAGVTAPTCCESRRRLWTMRTSVWRRSRGCRWPSPVRVRVHPTMAAVVPDPTAVVLPSVRAARTDRVRTRPVATRTPARTGRRPKTCRGPADRTPTSPA
jgi:hypothetical protein